MSTKEFSLMIDLMIKVSETAGEGELTALLRKYQQTPDIPERGQSESQKNN